MKKLNKKAALILTGVAVPVMAAALLLPRLLRRRGAKKRFRV